MHGKYLIVLFIIVCASCIPNGGEVPDDPRTFDPSDMNLLDLSSSLPYFKDFIHASGQAKITDLLGEEGPYTIFMPNQWAFSKFRIENGINSTDQLPDDKLKDILLYHIIHGEWLLLQIPTGYYPTLALEKTSGNPIDLFIDNSDLFRLNGVFVLDEPDLGTSNGVIHSITSVLNRPTILSHLSVNIEFSMIYHVLNRSDIRMEFLKLFDQEGPCTFLAPTNEAMEIFLEEHEEWKTYENIPSEFLSDLLKYHLVSEKNILVKNIIQTKEVTALNGATFVIESEYPNWKILGKRGQIANITKHDIQGIDGVIHQIDRVLIP